jgi:uncharacterized protein
MTPKSEDSQGKTASTRACPICGKPARPAEHPFCSRRCADIDLHRWLKGAYTVPVRPEADEPPEGVPPEEED